MYLYLGEGVGTVDAAVSVIAGGTAGIGLATAVRLAEDGGDIAVIGRRPGPLQAAGDLLRQAGAHDVVVVQADATNDEEVAAAFDIIGSRFAAVNVLVNTIGPASPGTFEDLDDDAWSAAFDEGVLSGVRLVRHALPLLRRASWARIVAVTAMSVQHQSGALVAYTASKAALASITKNMARTLAAEEILVNAVAPGPVLTGAIRRAVAAGGGRPDDVHDAYRVMAERYGACVDLRRVAQPSEVAEVIAFCASRANTFMTGATLNVDGGSDFV